MHGCRGNGSAGPGRGDSCFSCLRAGACAFAPKLATPRLIIPDHIIGAASKSPRCQPCSVRKEGGELRVTAANPMAANHSETVRVFDAGSVSEGLVRRDA